MAELDTRPLPLLALSTGVVLPQMVVTLALETPEAAAAAEAAVNGDNLLLLVPNLGGHYARVGTVARVDSAGQLPNGTDALILRGLHRATLGAGVAGSGPALWVQAAAVDDGEVTDRAHELARELRAVVSVLAERRRSRRMPEALANATDPAALPDAVVGVWPELPRERVVEVLETLDPEERIEKVLGWARDALAEMELAERIRSDVAEGMEKTQREFLLRQQLAAIRRELGEADEEGGVDGYRARLAESEMPAEVLAAVEKEIARLEKTAEQSPEHGWIRAWLDTILELPWGRYSDDHLDVQAARDTLDADHTGLDDVKDRIVEYLAVRGLRAERGMAAARPRPSRSLRTARYSTMRSFTSWSPV